MPNEWSQNEIFFLQIFEISKELALRRLVRVENPDIIFLQETLGNGEVVSSLLESMFGGCKSFPGMLMTDM